MVVDKLSLMICESIEYVKVHSIFMREKLQGYGLQSSSLLRWGIKKFSINVKLHQRSTFSLLLFILAIAQHQARFKINWFKLLGLCLSNDRALEDEVWARIRASWNRLRKDIGVLSKNLEASKVTCLDDSGAPSWPLDCRILVYRKHWGTNAFMWWKWECYVGLLESPALLLSTLPFQEWPQQIILFRLSRSIASSSIYPTTFKSSFTLSINRLVDYSFSFY